jgi:hypothetical protein
MTSATNSPLDRIGKANRSLSRLIRAAALVCLWLLVVATVMQGFLASPARADVPALCGPAKTRHDRAVASGERSAVLAARERIKALAGACPQLWAAVRNAPLPREKEQAKSAQPQQQKTEPKAKTAQRRGIQFDEPTISQLPTKYVGDGDPAESSPVWMRWLLLRTQQGCYFFQSYGGVDYETKGLAGMKKYWATPIMGQFRWKGQCTPGKLINGTGTLERKSFPGSVGIPTEFVQDDNTGTMINGLWHGNVTRTLDDVGSGPYNYYFVYRMGCVVPKPGQQDRCLSPRIAPELVTDPGATGVSTVPLSGSVTQTSGPCRWLLDGEWVGQSTGNRVGMEMRGDGFVSWIVGQPKPGQSAQNNLFRDAGPKNWSVTISNGARTQASLLDNGQLKVTNPDGWSETFRRVNPASIPVCN